MEIEVGDIVYRINGRLRDIHVDVIEQTIIAAIEEEREACAKIADKYRATLTRNAPPEPMNIAREIRARKSKGD